MDPGTAAAAGKQWLYPLTLADAWCQPPAPMGWSAPYRSRASPIMFKLRMIQILLSLLVLLDYATAQTLRNNTVDDTDSAIAYVGAWDPSSSHLSTLDIGGSHTLSTDAAGSATFTFTGVAVYYLSPKWPYTVDSYVSLDGGAPIFVNMTAPPQNSPNGEETVQSAPLWSATGLSNGPHRVVVTRGPSGYAVVDGFIYTAQSADTTTNPQSVSTVTVRTTQGTSSTTSGTSTSSTSSNTTNSTVIIAITVSASVACIILLTIIFFFIRRKKNTDTEYRNSTAFGPTGGRETTYTIPGREANTYSASYSAVPLTENHPYTYPYPSNNAGSGMEMGMRDSRYSAMGYSDSTTTGSASGAGSLSAQQQMSYANIPYGQDAYGLYPVSNRALVVPAAGAAYNTGGSGSGTDWYNASAPATGGGYHGGDYSGGQNVATTYAGVGSSAAVNPPNPSPSPLSARSRLEGSYIPYTDGSNEADAAYSGYAPSTSTVAAVPLAPPARQVSPVSEKARYNPAGASGYKKAHPYNATGPISPSEPPPSYAARPEGSSSRPTPSSPPRPNKQGFI